MRREEEEEREGKGKEGSKERDEKRWKEGKGRDTEIASWVGLGCMSSTLPTKHA